MWAAGVPRAFLPSWLVAQSRGLGDPCSPGCHYGLVPGSVGAVTRGAGTMAVALAQQCWLLHCGSLSTLVLAGLVTADQWEFLKAVENGA